MSNEDTTISPTDAIFARAYANAVKNQFQIEVGDHYAVLTSPVTQRGIPAGDLIYDEMANYFIYKFADSLQYANHPTYTGGSAGSYIQQLQSYLNWIKTRAHPSSIVAYHMDKARNAENDATEAYNKMLAEAQLQYNKVKTLYPNLNFWKWVDAYNPPLFSAEQILKAAKLEYQQAMQAYYGPDYNTLSKFRTGVNNARGDKEYDGYNMPGLIKDKDMIAAVIKEANSGEKYDSASIKQSTVRVPNYSIGQYGSEVQAWITQSAHGDERKNGFTVDISQGQTTTWKDYGFKEVKGGGAVGFWPFFSGKVLVDGKWETRTLETKGLEKEVSLELKMIGISKFDVKAGQWDVPNIKAMFPNRLEQAPPALTSEYARVVSVLVGYDVELRVEFGSKLKEQVNKIYEEVKETGGELSVFGFSVSAEISSGELEDRVETEFKDVQWDKATGSMSMTPSKGQVYPTILGVIVQRFD